MGKQRDGSIDIFKGLLVVGMVCAHVMQFYSDVRLYPASGIMIDAANIITFSGFVFSFGYVTQLAYYSKPLKQVYRNMLITALKTLIAFYISGICYRMFLDSRTLDWGLVKSIVALEDIPGWSEFLVSFSIIMAAGIALFKPLCWLIERKPMLWIAAALLLLATFIDYGSVTINQLGLLIGTRNFAAFPVLQYFPFYLIGMYFAKYKVGWNWRVLAVSIAATGIFALYWIIDGHMPSRFPPSIYWILSPCVLLYGYYMLSRLLDRLRAYTGFLRFMGSHVLFYLLLSNMMIFALKKNQPFLLLSAFESLLFTACLLLVIGYLLKLKKG